MTQIGENQLQYELSLWMLTFFWSFIHFEFKSAPRVSKFQIISFLQYSVSKSALRDQQHTKFLGLPRATVKCQMKRRGSNRKPSSCRDFKDSQFLKYFKRRWNQVNQSSFTIPWEMFSHYNIISFCRLKYAMVFRSGSALLLWWNDAYAFPRLIGLWFQ